jgi:hypothetical protein
MKEYRKLTPDEIKILKDNSNSSYKAWNYQLKIVYLIYNNIKEKRRWNEWNCDSIPKNKPYKYISR